MRLIDADKLRFTNEWLSDESGTAAQFMMVSKADVDAAPTVDAESVKHGHWIHKFGYNGERHTVCSSCGHDRRGHFSFSFCMDCGAKMDEEAKNEAD